MVGHRTNGRSHKARELRRRVRMRARMRSVGGWSDACILNISSRGMLIHSAAPLRVGSAVELWHGERAVTASVAWRKGPRVGLRADERVPVELLIALSAPRSLCDPVATTRTRRRKPPRTHDESAILGRAMQFATAAAIAAALASGMSGLVYRALAQPIGAISQPLAR